MPQNKGFEPLLRGISQYDVDFVIPRKGVDLPLGIDPFLLFKSRDPEYRELHDIVLSVFNAGIDSVRAGDIAQAKSILTFPEVSEIGLGYTRTSRRGSGVGTHLTELIVETLTGSPQLLERGVRHIEEMQLLSAGIGPDRISDIVANILKRFLISYTQRQCKIWEIVMSPGVPIAHIYNHPAGGWEDSHEELPVSGVDGSPILLVPRRIVRTLPWINYDDFVRGEFSAYLAARRESVRKALAERPPSQGSGVKGTPLKSDVVTVTRGDIALVERYIRAREAQAADARPAMDYIDADACGEAETLKEKIRGIPPGREHAAEYQRVVLEVINYLFNPELIDGQPEVRTVDGTERRDIIFTNDSDEAFWVYVRTTHDSLLVMFEVKNTAELDMAAINQTAVYLGDRIGRLGFIVTRHAPSEGVMRKTYAVWNDSGQGRKAILILADAQLFELLDLRCKDGSPTKWMQKHYRAFRTALQ
jgi:hypothetical protein